MLLCYPCKIVFLSIFNIHVFLQLQQVMNKKMPPFSKIPHFQNIIENSIQ